MENNGEPEFGNQGILHLDEDERHHMTQISEDTGNEIALVNVGAMLSANFVSYSSHMEGADINSPLFIKALLTLKCSNLPRLVATGLATGYYTGVSILIRSALESLAYLHLFDQNPDEIKTWLRLELHPTIRNSDRYQEQSWQRTRAKTAFAEGAADVEFQNDLVDYWWGRTSGDIHTSAISLAEGFGLKAGDFMPDGFWQILDRFEGNWDQALNIMVSKSPITIKTDQKSEVIVDRVNVYTELIGRFDAEHLELLTIMGALSAHRLVDISADIFEIREDNLKADYDRFHTHIRRIAE